MRCLIDTHVFLWLACGSSQLPPAAIELFEDPKNDFLLSRASVWEMAIKQSLGRLKLGRSLTGLVEVASQEQGIGLLGIELAHVTHVASLPFHHRDPFDRLLVAQALIDGLPLLSDNHSFDEYGVLRIWPG